MENREDRDAILYSGPHLFYGRVMIVKQWTADFSFHQEILKVVPVWVKWPNLPLNCWSTYSLSRLGSLLGVPIYADECTTKQLRISFARILIEMDVTREIPEEIQFEDPNGACFKQKVTYDLLPPFCKKCQMIGHQYEATGGSKPKVTKKWVPKGNVVPQSQPKVTGEDARTSNTSLSTLEVGIGAKEGVSSIFEDPPSGIPSHVTPVVTSIPSTQKQIDEEEGAWKLVTRKSKDKGKQVAYKSARASVQYELQSGEGISVVTEGAKGPNPYLS